MVCTSQKTGLWDWCLVWISSASGLGILLSLLATLGQFSELSLSVSFQPSLNCIFFFFLNVKHEVFPFMLLAVLHQAPPEPGNSVLLS